MSKQTATDMIFVTSRDGISHHPDEFTEDELLIKGTNVLLRYLTEQ